MDFNNRLFGKFSKVFALIPDNNYQGFKRIITHHGFGMTHMPGCVGKTA